MRSGFVIVGSCVVMLFVVAGCSKSGLSGAELYSTNCANCHGRYADGEGPAAADMAVPVPDLRHLAARNGGVLPRAWVADVIDGRTIMKAHGDRHMPVWGDAFERLDDTNGPSKARTDAKIQALVDYLDEVQQK